MFNGRKCQIRLIDPFFFGMYLVSLRLTFNLRFNLEVNEDCEGQNLTNCYKGSLWKRNWAHVPNMYIENHPLVKLALRCLILSSNSDCLRIIK